jgi:hypothetical protein
MWNRIRRFFVKPAPIEITDAQMQGLEALANLYHGAVRKYGDDGHDQFVELMNRVPDRLNPPEAK